MTNEEAIKLIRDINEDGRNITYEHMEALRLAIKALEEPENVLMTEEEYAKFKQELISAPTVEIFTKSELDVIADAVNYLLGAELLEENGYTEEVLNALKSVLQKIGAEEDHL